MWIKTLAEGCSPVEGFVDPPPGLRWYDQQTQVHTKERKKKLYKKYHIRRHKRNQTRTITQLLSGNSRVKIQKRKKTYRLKTVIKTVQIVDTSRLIIWTEYLKKINKNYASTLARRVSMLSIPLSPPQISLSSGGGFMTLSNSTLGLQYSWELGLYVPLVALLFRAIMKNITMLTISPIKRTSAIGTTILAMFMTLSAVINWTWKHRERKLRILQIWKSNFGKKKKRRKRCSRRGLKVT